MLACKTWGMDVNQHDGLVCNFPGVLLVKNGIESVDDVPEKRLPGEFVDVSFGLGIACGAFADKG